MKAFLLAIPMALTLVGCSSGQNTADLKSFVQETLNKPRGVIDPIPVFQPYEYFSYSASGLRSPFDLPIVEEVETLGKQDKNVQPDTNRRKEHLESYAIGSLSMVGVIQKEDGIMWALVKDGDNSVVPVKSGNYMGQNHGRITDISEQRMQIIEIVPNGMGGWIERPRTLAIGGLVGE